MLRFEGDRDFSTVPADLFTKLSDARFLLRCVPDVSSVTSSEPDQAVFVVRPGFSFVRGTLDTTLKVSERTSPTTIRFLLQSKGIGSSSEIEAVLTLTPHDTGTRVHHVAEVKNLGGLLKLLPHGLICGAAQKAIDDVWTTVEMRVREDAQPGS